MPASIASLISSGVLVLAAATNSTSPGNSSNIFFTFSLIINIFLFKEKVDQVECLIGYEGNAFAFTSEPEEDILSITSVHPMREDALKDFLGRAHSNWSLIERLIKQGKLVESEYEGHKFYIRKFKKLMTKNPEEKTWEV